MKILLKNLPSQAESKKFYYEEFFNLIASIVRASGDNFVLEPKKAHDPIEIDAFKQLVRDPLNPISDIANICVNEEQFSASTLLSVFVMQIKKRPLLDK